VQGVTAELAGNSRHSMSSAATIAVAGLGAPATRSRTAFVPRRQRLGSIAPRECAGLDWDDFVRARPGASRYLLSGWTELVGEVFGHQTYFIEARSPLGELRGILPLVRQKSLLFGDTLTSGAFFNYGGALADREEDVLALMECARGLAQRFSCRYLELRDVRQRSGNWQLRTDKASLILSLPANFEALSKQLGSKLRSQVKRAEREQAAVWVGGKELLDDFYTVFCEGMHRLGTPVYPRQFFAAILERFTEETLIVVVHRDGLPAAAAFMTIFDGTAEVPWAACRHDCKSAGFNMKLYWEALHRALDRGCTHFDFGRSTIGGGTYRFKLQWGAEPRQLYWHRWQRRAGGGTSANVADSESRLRNLATAAWKRLPRVVANSLGPLVSPSLPW
jgi:FemAB-related protein (PEP-CTERM system-associated)